MISTAVISHGISARTFHIPFIKANPGFSLDMILERSGETAQEKYPNIKIARTIDEVLNDPGIELVVICSPNETHFPYAKAALLAGKHVVVEKPFTNTSEEAKELIALSASTGKVCSVYQNRRYVTDFLTMKKIVDDGMLGEPREFFAHYDRYRPDPRTYGLWREQELPGSGIFYDLGPHLIDQSLMLFGMPTSINADIRRMKPYSKVDDYFDLRLEYENLIVTLHASMLVREMGPRYMVHGTKGSYIKYGEDPQEEMLKAGIQPVGPEWGKEDPSIYGLIHTELNGEVIRRPYPSLQASYGDYYKNLYNTIKNGAPLKETPLDGYHVIRLIEFAFQSSNEKRTITCSWPQPAA